MSNSGNHSQAKACGMDTLLKALNCLGKFLQIIQTGFTLMKHLGL